MTTALPVPMMWPAMLDALGHRYDAPCDRNGQIHYPQMFVTPVQLDDLEECECLPARREAPWKIRRGTNWLIGFWMKGEFSPRWYRAEVRDAD